MPAERPHPARRGGGDAPEPTASRVAPRVTVTAAAPGPPQSGAAPPARRPPRLPRFPGTPAGVAPEAHDGRRAAGRGRIVRRAGGRAAPSGGTSSVVRSHPATGSDTLPGPRSSAAHRNFLPRPAAPRPPVPAPHLRERGLHPRGRPGPRLRGLARRETGRRWLELLLAPRGRGSPGRLRWRGRRLLHLPRALAPRFQRADPSGTFATLLAFHGRHVTPPPASLSAAYQPGRGAAPAARVLGGRRSARPPCFLPRRGRHLPARGLPAGTPGSAPPLCARGKLVPVSLSSSSRPRESKFTGPREPRKVQAAVQTEESGDKQGHLT